jgi:hypothetical protein
MSQRQPRTLDTLADLQDEAFGRFELELNDVRSAMSTVMAQCEQSIARLRDHRWVPLDAASQFVNELAEIADLERARADRLAADLQATRLELEEVRAECRAKVEATRQSAIRYRAHATASYRRELNALREAAQAAVDGEARARRDLAATQARNQEIVDSQLLQLVELKRDLRLACAAAEQAQRAAVVKLNPRPQPNESERQPAPNRNHLTPEFEAIEAVLAGSPPVTVAWERIA